MHAFLDKRFTNHVHVASVPTVSSHFDTPFTQQDAPQCEPAFCNPVHVVTGKIMSIDMAHVLTFFQGPYPRPHPTQPSYPLPISSILVSPKIVSVQNLNKYVFPDSLNKNMHNGYD